MRVKTGMMCGKNKNNKNERKQTNRNAQEDRGSGIYNPNTNARDRSSEDFIFWEQQDY